MPPRSHSWRQAASLAPLFGPLFTIYVRTYSCQNKTEGDARKQKFFLHTPNMGLLHAGTATEHSRTACGAAELTSTLQGTR